MTCKTCAEDIHENNHGGWYHVKGWIEVTADHQAEPAS